MPKRPHQTAGAPVVAGRAVQASVDRFHSSRIAGLVSCRAFTSEGTSVMPLTIQVEVHPLVRGYAPGRQPRDELLLRQVEDPPGIHSPLTRVRGAKTVVVDRVAGLTALASNNAESRTDAGIAPGLLDDTTQLVGCQHRIPPVR